MSNVMTMRPTISELENILNGADKGSNLDILPDGSVRTSDFREDLEKLINKHSMENGSNTPDFILADYLQCCLWAFNKTMTRRDQWCSAHSELLGEVLATLRLNTDKGNLVGSNPEAQKAWLEMLEGFERKNRET